MFEWLEKAYEDRFMPMIFLKIGPVYDRFRSDPRFIELMKKMNLE